MDNKPKTTDEQKVQVLDKGFVVLQDVMGDDLAIVNAARISYLGDSKGEKSDKKLLFYLFKNRHTSPFEMVEFKFHVKCPLFIARQWMRHRTWSFNEISRRYTSRNIEFHIPTIWRRQTGRNKQGSEGIIIKSYSDELIKITSLALEVYNEAINDGIAREQARMFLPQALYTEFVGKVDAHNLMHFLRLRMSHHAQREMQLYARAAFGFFQAALPWTAEAFRKYDEGAPPNYQASVED